MIQSSKKQYPLRVPEEVRRAAEEEAQKNRRSLNVEFGLLIEEGLEWRKQRAQAAA